jgi:hypothetical protein
VQPSAPPSRQPRIMVPGPGWSRPSGYTADSQPPGQLGVCREPAPSAQGTSRDGMPGAPPRHFDRGGRDVERHDSRLGRTGGERPLATAAIPQSSAATVPQAAPSIPGQVRPVPQAARSQVAESARRGLQSRPQGVELRICCNGSPVGAPPPARVERRQRRFPLTRGTTAAAARRYARITHLRARRDDATPRDKPRLNHFKQPHRSN